MVKDASQGKFDEKLPVTNDKEPGRSPNGYALLANGKYVELAELGTVSSTFESTGKHEETFLAGTVQRVER
jgi:hypothetical protein